MSVDLQERMISNSEISNHEKGPGNSPDGVKRAAAPNDRSKALSFSDLFSAVVQLMMQSQIHRHAFLSDLEWMVLPPMRLGQFRLFWGENGPVAALFWAKVSDEVDRELTAGRTRLKPTEWNSGERIWLIESIAPTLISNTQELQRILNQLAKNAFEERSFKFRRTDPATGKVEVIEATQAQREATA